MRSLKKSRTRSENNEQQPSGVANPRRKGDNTMTSQEKWINIMKQIGTRFFILYPELGSVLVGDENFAVNINNHVGNEETRVAIVDFGKIDTSHMYLETTINCRNAHIFVSDTADAKSRSNPAGWAAILNGKYGVYVFQDIIVFEKWDD